MKKITLILIVTLLSLNSYAQSRDLGAPVLLVGMSQEYILKYLNQLNSLSALNSFDTNYVEKAIKKEYDYSGNLHYSVSFPEVEEKYFNCNQMTISFTKGNDGLICDYQAIYFTNISADANMNKLNKIFTKYKNNEWRFDYNSKYYVEATFIKIPGDSYGISYYLKTK